ncbi:MAG: DUF1189 family protein [Candidatus Erginobacter occultus]|nr:DUF1189 family protein [Candidatus Erginobacter occultus]
MGFKIQTLPATFYGCLTDFKFYRELIRRPLGEAFIYLLLLLLLPVLFLSGIQIYETNRLMTRITRSLQGNLPPLRIDKGAVIMDGKEYFHFETENEFTVVDWRQVLSLLTSRPDRTVGQAIQRREAGEELTPEEAAAVEEFENRRAAGEMGLAWIEERFPDLGAVITTGAVDQALEEDPPQLSEVEELLRESSHFFNFVFRVDLTTDEPQLPPGMMGFALGSHSYTINNPIWPQKISFPETTSEVINDATLDAWRKSFLWQLIPFLLGILLLVFYLVSLLVILGGAAAAGLTASLLKQALAFRRLFALALYALTPAVIFILLYLGLLLARINIPYPFWIFLAVYGFYLVNAVRRFSSPD